jgi:hypothetical protein
VLSYTLEEKPDWTSLTSGVHLHTHFTTYIHILTRPFRDEIVQVYTQGRCRRLLPVGQGHSWLKGQSNGIFRATLRSTSAVATMPPSASSSPGQVLFHVFINSKRPLLITGASRRRLSLPAVLTQLSCLSDDSSNNCMPSMLFSVHFRHSVCFKRLRCCTTNCHPLSRIQKDAAFYSIPPHSGRNCTKYTYQLYMCAAPVLVVDFDDTITDGDTIGLLINAAIQAQSRGEPTTQETQERQEALRALKNRLVSEYVEAFQVLVERHLPENSLRKDTGLNMEHVSGFLDDLNDFETRMNTKVIDSGILAGLQVLHPAVCCKHAFAATP